MIRIGILGCGKIAQVRHIPEYADNKDCELYGFYNPTRSRAEDMAKKYGGKVYDTPEELLSDPDIDAVSVCAANYAHAELTIKALKAGKHVLCEKPMAMNAAEAEQMIAAAKKNDRLLMIGFVLRFGDEARIAKDFIDQDYLGDIYYSKATYLRRHGAPGGWFSDKSRSGGGPVIDLGVHVIDLTRYLMGRPKALSVFASTEDRIKNRPHLKTSVGWKPDGATPQDPYDVEDFAVALIRYEDSKTTLLETSYSINGEEVTKKELYGTKGGVNLAGKDMKIYTEVNGFLADITPQTANYNESREMFTAEMEHFVDCALNGTPCIATAEDGLEVMKILDAIYESARTGHEVIIK